MSSSHKAMNFFTHSGKLAWKCAIVFKVAFKHGGFLIGVVLLFKHEIVLFPPKISSFLIPTFTSPEFLANGFLFVCFLNNSVYPFIGQNIFDLTILKVNSFTDMENKHSYQRNCGGGDR